MEVWRPVVLKDLRVLLAGLRVALLVSSAAWPALASDTSVPDCDPRPKGATEILSRLWEPRMPGQDGRSVWLRTPVGDSGVSILNLPATSEALHQAYLAGPGGTLVFDKAEALYLDILREVHQDRIDSTAQAWYWVRTLLHMSHFYSVRGSPERADLLTAFAVSEACALRRNVGDLYWMALTWRGRVLEAHGRLEEAKVYFHRALEESQRLGQNPARIREDIKCLGRCYSSLGDEKAAADFRVRLMSFDQEKTEDQATEHVPQALEAGWLEVLGPD